MTKISGLILAVAVIVILGWTLLGQDQTLTNQTNQPNMNATSTSQSLVLQTNLGAIEVELLTAEAPKTVENFLKLARSGFYNGTMFHRVIKGFMIQGGDPSTRTEPTNWAIHGRGGPDYQFADEFNEVPLTRGILAMANAGPNTNGSQFFIVTAPKVDWLNTREPGVGWHTPFGRVTKGLDIVTKIENTKTNENDHPLENIVIESVDILTN